MFRMHGRGNLSKMANGALGILGTMGGLASVQAESFLLLISLLLSVVPASAEPDAFQSAVAFALTGRDDKPIRVIDSANCIFSINVGFGVNAGEEIFHLNNVQIDRLKMQETFEPRPLVDTNKHLTIELHGNDTVYENTKVSTIDGEVGRLLAQRGQPTIFGPTRSNEHRLSIITSEVDRVARAWKYIYAHGCKGQKSSF